MLKDWCVGGSEPSTILWQGRRSHIKYKLSTKSSGGLKQKAQKQPELALLARLVHYIMY